MVIFGKGGFAREVKAYFDGVSHLVDSRNTKTPLEAVIAIGDPLIREKVANEHSCQWLTLNFGRAHSSEIGEGTIICPGAVLTTNVKLGRHVIINLNCTVGHDCTIGDFTTLSPGVHVSGNVTIGKRCFVGSGAVIREGVTICDDATIGSGAVVLSDITEPGVYVGVPARLK